MDDDHFGPPVEATSEQLEGKFPYRGGFARRSRHGRLKRQFRAGGSNAYNKVVTPRRVPKDISHHHSGAGQGRPGSQSWRERWRKVVYDRGKINAVFTRAQRQNPCWYRGARE